MNKLALLESLSDLLHYTNLDGIELCDIKALARGALYHIHDLETKLFLTRQENRLKAEGEREKSMDRDTPLEKLSVSKTMEELECIHREEGFSPWMRNAAYNAIRHIRELKAELEDNRIKAESDEAIDEALSIEFKELRAKLEATQAELEETKAELVKANEKSASLYNDGVTVSGQNDDLRRQMTKLGAELARASHQCSLSDSYAANLEKSLSEARAQRDRFEGDLERCRENRQELERTSVPLEEHKLLKAKLEESHDTIKLLASVLRDTLKGQK